MKFLRLLAPLCFVSMASAQGYYEKTQEPPGTAIYAKGYGVKANGTTSDDLAMIAAATACSAVGGHLILPPGVILLDGTGGNSVALKGCWMQGAGGMVSAPYPAISGTRFNITSTSVSPFLIGAGTTVSDVIFYYPNQTSGTTVYPGLFVNDATHVFSHNVFDRITVANAYDGWVQSQPSGDLKVSNSTIFVQHYAFKIYGTGDSWVMSNDRFTPGPYLDLCPSIQATCYATVNAGAAVNAIFDVPAGGAGLSVNMNSVETFAWRYGFLVESGGNVLASQINIAWDGVGTLVDSSSGGTWARTNVLTGSASTCGVVTYGGSPLIGGNTPCFNLGVSSGLTINGMDWIAARGSFIVSAGSNAIYIRGLTLVSGIGTAADGSDYYFLDSSLGSNKVFISNSRIVGVASNAHSHGINFRTTNPFAANGFSLNGNSFDSLNDILTVNSSSAYQISNNVSTGSLASTLTLSGAGVPVYSGNSWDITPTGVPSVNTPYILAQGALHFVVPGSGTMGNNGALSAVPALAATVPKGYVFAYPGTIGNATAASVTITGTAGQFACTCTGLAVGQYMKLSGTYGGTGSIGSYADPTTYYVSATDGTSTFTLQTVGRSAVTTTAGTPTGITYAAGGGWFYATGVSTTAYTLFNNLYVSGTPTIPGSPTAFSTTGAGAYTATINVQWPGPLYTLAANSLGLNGALDTQMYFKYNNSAGAKTATMFLGGVTLLTAGPTTTTGVAIRGTTTNVGSASVQEGWQQQLNTGATSSLVEQTGGAQNTAADASVWIKLLLAATTDVVDVQSYSVEVRPN